MTLFAVHFVDARERDHVAAVRAATPERALQAVLAYQNDRGGFNYPPPDVYDVVEINPDAEEEYLQILWHEDYD